MKFFVALHRPALFAAGALMFAFTTAATAQPASEEAQIRTCLCMERSIATTSQEMQAKNQALDAVRRDLATLDAELQRAYPKVDVNNPQSEERFKALLQRRDVAYRQSVGQVYTDAATATARYNRLVQEYNERCAHQLFNSVVVNEMRAHLMCPAER